MLSANSVRLLNGDTSIESSRSQQGIVQNVRSVCRCQADYDIVLVRFKSIQLSQQLIECLFPFIVADASQS